MRIEKQNLVSQPQTVAKMKKWVKKYHNDMYDLKNMSLVDIYMNVRNIPFYKDDEFFEVIARPGYLLDPEIFPGMDCKKKSIILASWAELNSYPWKFVTASDYANSDNHHIYPIIKIPKVGMIAVDATMPENRLGQIVSVFNSRFYNGS